MSRWRKGTLNNQEMFSSFTTNPAFQVYYQLAMSGGNTLAHLYVRVKILYYCRLFGPHTNVTNWL